MKLISLLLLSTLFAQATGELNETHRYLRPAGEKYVLESEIVIKNTPDGSRYESVTHRGSVNMRLVISFDKRHNPRSAEIRLKNNSGSDAVSAEFKKSQIIIKKKDKESQRLDFKGQPVLVTTAPDWSDIILLLRRYNHKQGGKQEFAGLWFHPEKPARILTFVVEKKKAASITTTDGKIPLSHFLVRLRSGQYDVWADTNGLVYKLTPAGRPKSAVVLSGFEAAAKSLTR